MTGRSRALIAACIVFALAIGVLIGSGPLRAGIGGDATNELERAQAAAQAAAADASQGRDFADAAGPLAVRDRLAGHTVALVRTADATEADVDQASAHLSDAGVALGANVALTDQWTSEDRGPFREALAEQITSSLANPPEGATSSQVLSMALAQTLAPSVAAGDDLVGAAATERADTLWTLLTDAGLIVGERTGDSDMFLLVAPGGDVTDLANAFVATSNGTVVAFTGATAGQAGSATTVTNAAAFYGAWAVTGAAINAAAGLTGAYDASDAAQLIGALN